MATYRGGMTDDTAGAPEPDVLAMYDEASPAGLTCRVCGVLVSPDGGYPRVHWDWHEASNGA